ncbi:electron transfer flavoprotein subunit beta/FixA family protein [Tepidibacillus infernus]|uniref:Electron transfer flavoprotein subunit beta n=1 Tax=Tepidibacillus decaturensis TaxID=1413211 RepID=A0A135L4Y6_9BACI|nr:electron transfer flavoprotein subunit beta/FixA family protein [Tepidibacillus decaturensis]KXG43990.1 electron transfer flavoprotein subunit beta [Tepidibacillus decaturensis]
MDILVLLKQTFDTEEKIVLKDGQISEEGVEFIINPYDEYAVEEALKIKENHGGTITLLSLGPDRFESSIRTALAMGADQAILLDDENLFGDEYTVSQVLAKVIQEQSYDLILAGHVAVDDGSGQVPQRIAEILGIPFIGTAVKIELDDQHVTVHRDVEGDTEVVEASLPVLITTQQGLNEPRYPSLPGIMKAKKKPLSRPDVEIEKEAIQAKTETLETYLPSKKSAGRILFGEINGQAKELIQLLHNEAKVI